ncbi:hypothetical protein H0H92_009548 [Tricholoma furcatifolium]|nr:hypothetical protein H0H92_009548 [Tricholoma furcatifolium]
MNSKKQLKFRPATTAHRKTIIEPVKSDTLPPFKDAFLMTKLPSSDCKEETTMCVFSGEKHKKAITSADHFPSDMPRPSIIRYRIQPCQNGKGIFASSDIGTEDLILAERPMLMIPRGVSLVPLTDKGEGQTPMQLLELQLAPYNEVLVACVTYLDPKDQRTLGEMKETKEKQGYGPILERVAENALEIRIVSKDGETEFKTSCIFRKTSFAKHSCTPNAKWSFDIPTFSLRLHALRSIRAGEEITISYVPDHLSEHERRDFLLNYGERYTGGGYGGEAPLLDLKPAYGLRYSSTELRSSESC